MITDTALKNRFPGLRQHLTLPGVVFLAGVAALLLPTLYDVARLSWTTEQGSHGALVLASGLWLLLREKKALSSDPASANRPLAAAVIVISLLLFVAARITGIIEIAAIGMYGALLGALYLLWGGRTMRLLWFPLFYLALSLPPPDSVVATITLPIKMAISKVAVNLLYALGYPVASAGVTIQIAQFELLIAAACAGLNSIISLSAICLLYAYLRHHSNARYLLLLALAVLPIAIFANFVRVIILIMITYYFGEAAAQGFLHEFAGLLMFSVALITMFAIDEAALRMTSKRKAGVAAA